MNLYSPDNHDFLDIDTFVNNFYGADTLDVQYIDDYEQLLSDDQQWGESQDED